MTLARRAARTYGRIFGAGDALTYSSGTAPRIRIGDRQILLEFDEPEEARLRSAARLAGSPRFS